MAKVMTGFAFAVLLLCSTAIRAEEKVDVAKLNATVDAALKAYNDGDAKAFAGLYAKAMAQIGEAQFKLLKMDTFGKFVEKKAIEKETSINDAAPLLVFEAKFEKVGKVKISVNFLKEEKEFKLMQVQFAEIK